MIARLSSDPCTFPCTFFWPGSKKCAPTIPLQTRLQGCERPSLHLLHILHILLEIETGTGREGGALADTLADKSRVAEGKGAAQKMRKMCTMCRLDLS